MHAVPPHLADHRVLQCRTRHAVRPASHTAQLALKAQTVDQAVHERLVELPERVPLHTVPMAHTAPMGLTLHTDLVVQLAGSPAMPPSTMLTEASRDRRFLIPVRTMISNQRHFVRSDRTKCCFAIRSTSRATVCRGRHSTA